MQKSLFILHLSCLLLFNFNYSSEEVTKSATKQVILTLGYGAVTTALLAWTHKEAIFKGAMWATEAVANQWSHKMTRDKVDEGTHKIIQKIEKSDVMLINMHNTALPNIQTTVNEIKQNQINSSAKTSNIDEQLKQIFQQNQQSFTALKQDVSATLVNTNQIKETTAKTFTNTEELKILHNLLHSKVDQLIQAQNLNNKS